MATWEYGTEQWHSEAGLAPPNAARWGAAGWELVSVACYPDIRWEQVGDVATPTSFTAGAWLAAYYKRQTT